MKYVSAAAIVLVIAIGVAVVVYGGYDDAPGAQLLGVAIAVGAVWYAVRGLLPGRQERRRPRG